MYFPRKNTDIPRIKRFYSLSNQSVPVPEFSVNDRFVRSLNDDTMSSLGRGRHCFVL